MSHDERPRHPARSLPGFEGYHEEYSRCVDSQQNFLFFLSSLVTFLLTIIPFLLPGITYSVPDLDLIVRVRIDLRETGENIACVEARLENGKTVYQKGVSWAVAVIAGLALSISAIVSGLGHSNTAAHVASNALSLFGFFQSQAIIGMTAVPLPPIVQAWTQNFQWSMGIIRVGFLQTLATWYLRATGGKPSTTIASLQTQSVQVMKRSMEYINDKVPAAAPISRMAKRGATLMSHHLTKRSGEDSTVDPNEQVVVRGIERVGFRANMETTNIFLTGFIFFIVFVFIVILLVLLFKGYCEFATKKGWIKSNKFQEFRRGWKVVLRGILYRLTLIGYPQMCILCLWELTKRDSSAEVVLAVFMLIALNVSLYWAAAKVIMLAKRSTQLYKNPAYILYSDPAALNKWGFLYVNYRATAYYCVLPFLGYHLIKSMFIGLSQKAQVVQAVALLVIETLVLIGVSVLRPWMDKKTNIFNIAIAAVNFIDVILLLFFSNVFHQPGLVTGVMGVVFFAINVVFAFILLISVIASSAYAIISKNPDRRYQPMRDDRGSFMKDDSGNPINTELDALGATARDMNSPGLMGAPTEMHELKNATTTNTTSSATPMNPAAAESQSALGLGREVSNASSSNYNAAATNSSTEDGYPVATAVSPLHPGQQYGYASPNQHYGGGHGNGNSQLPSSVPLFPAVGGGSGPDERSRRSPRPQQQYQQHQQYSAFPSGNEYGNDMWR